MNNSSPFGHSATKYFYELTPEKILSAVEKTGLSCTGRVLTLNSMENRVYEVEIELDGPPPKNPSDKFRIIKFYRPGRWTKEQILEEHQFLLDLVEHEIPVVAPIKFTDNSTLSEFSEIGIYFAVFPKVGGRNPDELTPEQLSQIGRLLGRMHTVGRSRTANHRITLCASTYGINNLSFLLESGSLPSSIKDSYSALVKEICAETEQLYSNVLLQRIHGDCHLGNLLWGREGPFWVDFDDMVVGPQIQDLWLVVPGRDVEAKEQFEHLLSGYEQMSTFDRRTLRLIEPLRALRFIHFSAWIAKRWEDPAFKRTFVTFGTDQYWYSQLQDLKEQLDLIKQERTNYF